MGIDLDFAKNDQEAEERYIEFYNKDPFPEIVPALLNSADICDYVRVTGMIYPFHHEKDKKRLKSASYEMCLGGEILYWDEKGETENRPISENEIIKFERNSIKFVSVDGHFRIPNYIALRFNLQIEHVHKGLLLGTGPLVNPGFDGQLMIPIHNLTDNDYYISTLEPLIGVEFTKISPHDEWSNSTSLNRQNSIYIKNYGKKNKKGFISFIKTATSGRPVVSSLTNTLNDARSATDSAKEFQKKLAIGAVLGTLFSLLGLAFSIITLYQDQKQLIESVQGYATSLISKREDEVKQQAEVINSLKIEISDLKRIIETSMSKKNEEKK